MTFLLYAWSMTDASPKTLAAVRLYAGSVALLLMLCFTLGEFFLLLSLSYLCLAQSCDSVLYCHCHCDIASAVADGTAIDDDVFWVLCSVLCVVCCVLCADDWENNLTLTKSVNVCAHSLDGVCDRTVALHYICPFWAAVRSLLSSIKPIAFVFCSVLLILLLLFQLLLLFTKISPCLSTDTSAWFFFEASCFSTHQIGFCILFVNSDFYLRFDWFVARFDFLFILCWLRSRKMSVDMTMQYFIWIDFDLLLLLLLLLRSSSSLMTTSSNTISKQQQ